MSAPERRPLVLAKVLAATAGTPLQLGTVRDRVLSCTIAGDISFGIGGPDLQVGSTNTVILEAIKENNITRKYNLSDIWVLPEADGQIVLYYTVMSDEV